MQTIKSSGRSFVLAHQVDEDRIGSDTIDEEAELNLLARALRSVSSAFIISIFRLLVRPRSALHLLASSRFLFFFAYLAATRTRNAALVDIDAPSPSSINLDGADVEDHRSTERSLMTRLS